MKLDLEYNITGLLCGYLAVLIGQILVLVYHTLRVNRIGFKQLQFVQPNSNQARDNSVSANIQQFIEAPEGFLILLIYLAVSWIFKLFPATYYSFEGNVNWIGVFLQLLMVDAFMYIQHYSEHKIRFINIYLSKHYLHHQVTDPILFDAFKGNVCDTIYMILIPLHLTTIFCPTRFVCNVWTYMTFGAVYAALLLIIHSDYAHPWDSFFQSVGFATPAFHHTHHVYNGYNYAHLFEYYDRLFCTYKDPKTVKHINPQTCL